MSTKKTIIRSRRIRSRVRETQFFKNLSKIHQDMISSGQNITAIYKSLETVKTTGIKNWELISQNSHNNSEIIRELYAHSLELNF